MLKSASFRFNTSFSFFNELTTLSSIIPLKLGRDCPLDRLLLEETGLAFSSASEIMAELDLIEGFLDNDEDDDVDCDRLRLRSVLRLEISRCSLLTIASCSFSIASYTSAVFIVGGRAPLTIFSPLPLDAVLDVELDRLPLDSAVVVMVSILLGKTQVGLTAEFWRECRPPPSPPSIVLSTCGER
ncbi:hypothetical protein TRICI_000007 [Trichomonascus ciferrii]|uniref:Uncharacterized protein n=1 Tax=Trichomonascus ciferrii TaxID=44093 RepID=A0A642VEM4_9ASCO|nr:hypothetical protein TRICI_000007 [Trichomonascus ciferrii]